MSAEQIETNGTNVQHGKGAPSGQRRRRASSLMTAASALPSVDASLDDFIARANQTGVEVTGWGVKQTAQQAAATEVEEQRRRDADLARWKQAESQLRTEAEARENSLRGQLDATQHRLLETEAKLAVVATTGGSLTGMAAAPAATVDDSMYVAKITELETTMRESQARLSAAERRAQAAEQHAAQVERSTRVARATTSGDAPQNWEDQVTQADQRMRMAEMKAAKAIAAARAAAAGLTVSKADLDALAEDIDMGAAMAPPAPAATPWLKIGGAFAGGLVLMLLVGKLMGGGGKADSKAAAPVADVEPIAAPSVQPIEPIEPIEPTPAGVTPTPAPASLPETTPVAVPEAPPVAAEPVAPRPAPARPAVVAPVAGPVVTPVARPVARPVPTPVSRPAGGITDPFATAPARPTKPTKPAKPGKPGKPAGGIVDPFH